jgi:hypothetical protein
VGKEEDKMGMVLSNTADLVFEDVRIPVKNRVGEGRRGLQNRHEMPGPQPRRQFLRRFGNLSAGSG